MDPALTVEPDALIDLDRGATFGATRAIRGTQPNDSRPRRDNLGLVFVESLVIIRVTSCAIALAMFRRNVPATRAEIDAHRLNAIHSSPGP